jgi:hypothetical protein
VKFSEKLSTGPHHPHWLVVPCVECKGLAARWRCEEVSTCVCVYVMTKKKVT